MGLAASRQEAFWEACGFGHVQRARKFLEQGDIDVNWVSYVNDCSPIHVASQGKPEVVQLLLEYKCDVNVRDNRGNLAIHHAAMAGHADIVQTLIDAGSEIDTQEKNGWTALHNAAYWCHPVVVQTLIGRGCNVNIQNKDERTALHEVARSHSTSDDKLGEIAKMLIDAGSDINAKSSDRGEADLTGLMYAAYHNHPEVAQAFIDAGCELDAVGSTFWTALHWAAERGHDEIVYILVDAGANPLKTNMRGETAAEKAQSEEIRDVLIKAANMYRELHYMNRPLISHLPAPVVKPVEPYVPKCDANFKSESFLPKDWKPSANLQKLKELRERLREQHLRSIKNTTAVKTISQDTVYNVSRPNETNYKLRESSIDPDSKECSTDSDSEGADLDTNSDDDLTEENSEQNEENKAEKPEYEIEGRAVLTKVSRMGPEVGSHEKQLIEECKQLGPELNKREDSHREKETISSENNRKTSELVVDSVDKGCDLNDEKSETETQSFITCDTDNESQEILHDEDINQVIQDDEIFDSNIAEHTQTLDKLEVENSGVGTSESNKSIEHVENEGKETNEMTTEG